MPASVARSPSPLKSVEPLPAGAVAEVAQRVALTKAVLWSLEDPYLYEVDAALSVGDAVDHVDVCFAANAQHTQTDGKSVDSYQIEVEPANPPGRILQRTPAVVHESSVGRVATGDSCPFWRRCEDVVEQVQIPAT